MQLLKPTPLSLSQAFQYNLEKKHNFLEILAILIGSTDKSLLYQDSLTLRRLC